MVRQPLDLWNWEMLITRTVHSASLGFSLLSCSTLLMASLSGPLLSSAALLRVETTEPPPPDFTLPSSGILLPQAAARLFLVAAIVRHMLCLPLAINQGKGHSSRLFVLPASYGDGWIRIASQSRSQWTI